MNDETITLRALLKRALSELDGYAVNIPSDTSDAGLDAYGEPAQKALDSIATDLWGTDWPTAMRAGKLNDL